MRYFLDWTTDFPRAAAAWCRQHLRGAAPERIVIAVPTQHAGRLLRDALADASPDHGGFIGHAILTPMALPPLFTPPARLPTPTAILTAWRHTLQTAPPATLNPLFTGRAWLNDDASCFRMGQRLQNLRAELAEGAYTLREIARRGIVEEEPERWQALADLETRYLAAIAQTGCTDPVAHLVAALENPQPPAEIERLVFAGVPDPVPALCRLMETVPTDILIQAPPTLSHAFDPYGRPLAAPASQQWTPATPLPLPDSAITLAQDPEAQALAAVELMHRAGRPPDRIGIGLLDPAVAPPLTAALGLAGITPFDPAPRPLSRRPLSRLALLLADLAENPTRHTLGALLSHPYTLTRFGSDPLAILGAFDTLCADHLPADLPAARAFLTPDSPLAPVLDAITQWQTALRAAFIPALRDTLRAICATIPADPEDPDAQPEIDGLNQILRELETAPLPHAALTQLLRIRLESLTANPDRTEEPLAYQGLIELAWTPADLLIILGFNDGIIPDSLFSDTFLPNTLRERLSRLRSHTSPPGTEWFRHDATRYARDTYLLSTLLASPRRTLHIILGRANDRGDPLRPSRLLFHTPSEHLPARARHLFRELDVSTPPDPAESHLLLEPFTLPKKPWRLTRGLPTLSPSAIKDYLRCPFRFYLKHRLGLEPLETGKTAPNILEFGTLLHEAIQPLSDPQSPLSACTDPEKLTRALTRRLLNAIRTRYGATPPLGVEAAQIALKARIDAFIPHHIALREEGWEPVAAEWEGHLTLHGFHIRGRIDRIDRNTRTGLWRVYDYKTFDTPATPPEKHTRPPAEDTPPHLRVDIPGKTRPLPRAWADLQLPLYREFLRAAHPQATEIELAYALFPAATGETKISPWEGYSHDLHAAALAALQGTLAAIARDAPSDYWPPAEIREEEDPYTHIIQSFKGTLLP